MTELANSLGKKAHKGAVDELLSQLLDDAFYGKTLLAVTGALGHDDNNLSARFASQFAAEAECLSFSASYFHSLDRDKFLSLLVSRLGPEAAEYAGDSHLLTIADYAGSLADQERLLILLIDEAQTLTPALLETLYELVDEADEASLSCVLFGDTSLASVIERVDPDGGVEDFTWYELPNAARVQPDSESPSREESGVPTNEFGNEIDVSDSEASEDFSAEAQSRRPEEVEQHSDYRAAEAEAREPLQDVEERISDEENLALDFAPAEDALVQAAKIASEGVVNREEQSNLDFAYRKLQQDHQTQASYAAEGEELGAQLEVPALSAQEQVSGGKLLQDYSSAKEGVANDKHASGAQHPSQRVLSSSPEPEFESLDSTRSEKKNEEALHDQFGEEFEKDSELDAIIDEASPTILTAQEQDLRVDEEDDFDDTEDEFDQDIDHWLEPDRQPQLGSASSDALAFDFDGEEDRDQEDFAEDPDVVENKSRFLPNFSSALGVPLLARMSSAANFVKHLFLLLIDRLSAGRLYWMAAAALAIAFVAVLAFWRIPVEPAPGRIELGSPLLSSTESNVNITSSQSLIRSVEPPTTQITTQGSTQGSMRSAPRQPPQRAVSLETAAVAQQANAQVQAQESAQSSQSLPQDSAGLDTPQAPGETAPTVDLVGARQVSAPESRPPAEQAEPAPDAVISDSFADTLLAAAPTSYTLQILGSSSEAAVQEFVAQNAAGLLQTLGYYSSRRAGQAWYVVSYGVFADRNAAQATLNRLPSRLSTAGPWVRQLEAVQAAIQQAR